MIKAIKLNLSRYILIECYGYIYVKEIASWESQPFLNNVSDEEIVLVGDMAPNVLAVKFWLDKVGIRVLLQPEKVLFRLIPAWSKIYCSYGPI